jgi:hypothetical protein
MNQPNDMNLAITIQPAPENPAPRPPRPRAAVPGLLLHCGAGAADRETVFATPTPPPTGTWFPLPHRDLVEEVEGQLDAASFTVTGESHALSHDGARYFGLFEVRVEGSGTEHGYTWIVGIRNSHDKTYPAGLVAGTKVFVCDNLSFTGEVRISRKHTRFAARDLRHLTARAIGQLGDQFSRIDRRIEAYRNRSLGDPEAHDLVIRAVDCRAITPLQVPDVLREWRQPSHPEFGPRTAWSLFNAVTEIHKGLNPHVAVARGQALHGLFDQLVGMN